ncbi:ankyrin repeat-domain protein [Diplogelasinospora grovesii]|uniref:Ankyrin repeat-domain protein n=1 Tax=Diplogelasinospora grovesii TaxID=303347 RepID=A0AAN6S764_9PEZI|nr:ankyrin repeat-domain protein [Diplogelasinospora grovesii]
MIIIIVLHIITDLHELFRDILTRDSLHRGELLLCIQWVLFARQPLNPVQLYSAILSGVEPASLSPWEPDEVTGDIVKKFILDSSKGLAEVTKSKLPTVQFIHESVRDFLLKEKGVQEIWPDLGRNFEGESHERLKQCCLTYMSVGTAGVLYDDPLPEAKSQGATKLRESANKAFPPLEYAVGNLLHHADAAGGSGVNQKGFIETLPLPDWIKLHNVFAQFNTRRYTANPSVLYILAEHNMKSLIKAHPSPLEFFELEADKELRYGAPIFAALATDSFEAVGAFLEAQAETQQKTSELHSLYKDYMKGQRRFTLKGKRGFTFSPHKGILVHLVEYGDVTLLKFFVASLANRGRQFDVESRNNKGQTLLSLAAYNGCDSMMRYLLDLSADVHTKDSDGRTLLSLAACGGNKAIVEVLLDRGLDIESRDEKGRTPLSWAAKYGKPSAIEAVLNRRADIESRDEDGRTPLSLAVIQENPSKEAVEVLLNRGAAIESRDKDGRNPLSLAVTREKPSIEVVEVLLDRGAAIESRDKDGRTPLFLAVIKDKPSIEVVEVLLNRGADIESQDRIGCTPLSFVVMLSNPSVKVVEALLNRGADIKSRDKNGRTPLSAAAESRWGVTIVEALLHRGADIESRDKTGFTPLSHAVKKGRTSIVAVLLNRGADIESRDEKGRTPLSHAAKEGTMSTVEVLLNRGADVEAMDNDGHEPLWWAITRSNPYFSDTQRGEIIALLRDRGTHEEGIGAEDDSVEL